MTQVQKKPEATEFTPHLGLQRKKKKVLPETGRRESYRIGHLERNKDLCAMDSLPVVILRRELALVNVQQMIDI